VLSSSKSNVTNRHQIPGTRSAGVTAAATLGILCSVSALLVWGWFFLSMMSIPADGSGRHFYELHTDTFLALAILPPLLVAMGLRISVGLFQLKPWARRGALLWAVLAFVFSSLIIAFKPYETFAIPDDLVSPVASIKQLLAISFVVFTFPLGAWWLLYFTRGRVIAQFAPSASEETPASPAKPA
jgi:hypothetical protein